MNHGKLVDHVVARAEHVTHAGGPLRKGLAHGLVWHSVDGPAAFGEAFEVCVLVQVAFVHQEPSEATDANVGRLQLTEVGEVAQRQIVSAIQPRGDLRRGEKSVRHLDHCDCWTRPP
jgi:hypothetical protein